MVEVRRLASLLWFPFFFVAVMALLLLTSFSTPTPHRVRIDVAGTSSQVEAVQIRLAGVRSGGFSVEQEPNASTARRDVADGDVAAAIVLASKRVLVASGSGAERAGYLERLLPTVCAVTAGGSCAVVDAAPVVPGDLSGQSLTFFGLPLLLVGMIASVVLAQFPTWRLPFKLITVAVAGGFGTVFSYLVALSLGVIPNDEWLLLYGFLLTQAIGLLCLGAMPFTRRFFFPVAVTFVLVLGIPSSGGPVNGDMLPGFVGWLNSFMPFAKFMDLVRATAYLGDSGLGAPLIVLCAWVLGGALLVAAGAILARRRRAAQDRRIMAELAATPQPPERSGETGSLYGAVRTNTGSTIGGARVVVLDERGDETARALTDEDGQYRLPKVAFGLHHLVVSAVHCEPVVVPIALHSSRPHVRRDVLLLDWSGPAGNLMLVGPQADLLTEGRD